MKKNSEIDVIKIFAEMETKAKEINPNLIPQIETYNSNQAGLDILHTYQQSINQTSSQTSTSTIGTITNQG